MSHCCATGWRRSSKARATASSPPSALPIADDLRRTVGAHRPELVVVDVVMPPNHHDDGLRAAVDLRQANPDLRVMILSQYVEVSYLYRLLGEDSVGIGYLLKQRIANTGEFLDALARVWGGSVAIDPEVISAMMGRTVLDDPLERLTTRQREVLALIAEGCSNAAIAERLVLSEPTVESHISSIMSTLDLPPSNAVHRRVAAVLKFLEASGP
jgi:DNA-binding NarL/FixJ family response regulator